MITYADQVVLGVAQLGQYAEIEDETGLGEFELLEHSDSEMSGISVQDLDARRVSIASSVVVTSSRLRVSRNDRERNFRVVEDAFVDFLDDGNGFGHNQRLVNKQSLLYELK